MHTVNHRNLICRPPQQRNGHSHSATATATATATRRGADSTSKLPLLLKPNTSSSASSVDAAMHRGGSSPASSAVPWGVLVRRPLPATTRQLPRTARSRYQSVQQDEQFRGPGLRHTSASGGQVNVASRVRNGRTRHPGASTPTQGSTQKFPHRRSTTMPRARRVWCGARTRNLQPLPTPCVPSHQSGSSRAACRCCRTKHPSRFGQATTAAAGACRLGRNTPGSSAGIGSR